MSVIRTQTAEAVKREFAGKGWINTVNKEGSKVDGVKFINVTLDRSIDSLTLKAGDRIQLWPNVQREGKKDADYRMSILFVE